MPNIGRRGFLSLIATAMVASGVELDADKLLWVPGEKKFFLPPVNGWKRSDWLKDAKKLQQQKNALDSILLDEVLRAESEAAQRPGVQNLQAIAQIVHAAFEREMGSGIVGMIGDPRDGMGWRPGDQLQVRINSGFARLHNRPDKADVAVQVITEPVKNVSNFLEVTDSELQRSRDGGIRPVVLEDIGRAMADLAKKEGLTMFVQPMLSTAAKSSRSSSLKSSVRVIEERSHGRATTRYYFDVLGAKV